MRLIDADKARDSLNERLKCCNAGSIVEACYLSAIDILDTTPTIAPPPNDPLTMEELREMALEPEPVWCEKFGWRICYGVTDFRGCLCMETGAGNCINLKDYGRTWIAYRRRPEEEN